MQGHAGVHSKMGGLGHASELSLPVSTNEESEDEFIPLYVNIYIYTIRYCSYGNSFYKKKTPKNRRTRAAPQSRDYCPGSMTAGPSLSLSSTWQAHWKERSGSAGMA